MSAYLVTGGAGFIGSHLVAELRHRRAHVRIVDNLSTGKRRNLEGLGPFEFLEGDLADADVATAAVHGMDYVLHQAALPSVPRSVEDPVSSHRANVDATLNLLMASREAGIRRVVFAGSSSVYGNSPELPKGEEMPPRPLSPYALQKLIGEQYAAMFSRLYGLETVTIRYFNVFGPRQDPSSPYSGVISRFATALLDGRSPCIYGDGEQTRDFTYVENVVSAVLAACDAPDVSGEVLNVATGHRVSLNLLFRTLRDLIGASVEPLYEETRAGDVRDSLADISKAERLLGYRVRVGFEEGLRRTVDWYREERETLAPQTARSTPRQS